jgi:hypothetical protein
VTISQFIEKLFLTETPNHFYIKIKTNLLLQMLIFINNNKIKFHLPPQQNNDYHQHYYHDCVEEINASPHLNLTTFYYFRLSLNHVFLLIKLRHKSALAVPKHISQNFGDF